MFDTNGMSAEDMQKRAEEEFEFFRARVESQLNRKLEEDGYCTGPEFVDMLNGNYSFEDEKRKETICDRCIHKNVCKIECDINNCADFFELVKCQDCKHRSKIASEDSWGVEDWVCNHDYGCAKCDDGDFCHYGERKKTE